MGSYRKTGVPDWNTLPNDLVGQLAWIAAHMFTRADPYEVQPAPTGPKPKTPHDEYLEKKQALQGLRLDYGHGNIQDVDFNWAMKSGPWLSNPLFKPMVYVPAAGGWWDHARRWHWGYINPTTLEVYEDSKAPKGSAPPSWDSYIASLPHPHDAKPQPPYPPRTGPDKGGGTTVKPPPPPPPPPPDPRGPPPGHGTLVPWDNWGFPPGLPNTGRPLGDPWAPGTFDDMTILLQQLWDRKLLYELLHGPRSKMAKYDTPPNLGPIGQNWVQGTWRDHQEDEVIYHHEKVSNDITTSFDATNMLVNFSPSNYYTEQFVLISVGIRIRLDLETSTAPNFVRLMVVYDVTNDTPTAATLFFEADAVGTYVASYYHPDHYWRYHVLVDKVVALDSARAIIDYEEFVVQAEDDKYAINIYQTKAQGRLWYVRTGSNAAGLNDVNQHALWQVQLVKAGHEAGQTKALAEGDVGTKRARSQ
ncbi:capsid protein [Circoviridae sp.]|nr:capsid protein [Circoviridae sp.]